MASEIKVDTISEKTSANGVTIDSLSIKDGGLVAAGNIDVNGNNLVLDANANTYLDAGTDDTIKVYVSGAEDLRIAANAINVLSGTTLTIDSGATIANSGTATGFSSADPASADGDALGTASLEWSDLYLADSSVIYFGNDQDTTLTHTDGTGLTLNSTNKLCFNDASQYIQGASNAILDIAATDEIELTATLLDVNANLDVSGTSLLPTLGVITAKDLGAGIHIRTADSSASALAGADELVIENNGVAGLSILTSTSTAGTIAFGDSGDNDIGKIAYDHSTNDMIFTTNTSEGLRITDDDKIYTGGETAGGDITAAGICVQQGAADGGVLGFQSSDIAHAMTERSDADTFGWVNKAHATNGGLKIQGLSESSVGMQITAHVTAVDTAKGDANSAIYLDAWLTDGGTTSATMSSNSNIFGVNNNGYTQFLVDAEGDLHADGSATTVFDKYEDAQLVRALDLSKGEGRGVINSKFDKFIAYNHEHLAEMRLVGRDKDNKPNYMINVTGMQRLHNGAIWQQYEKHQRLLEAVYDLAKEAVGEEKADAILDKHEVKRLQ
jgi:hypothetical protein